MEGDMPKKQLERKKSLLIEGGGGGQWIVVQDGERVMRKTSDWREN